MKVDAAEAREGECAHQWCSDKHNATQMAPQRKEYNTSTNEFTPKQTNHRLLFNFFVAAQSSCALLSFFERTHFFEQRESRRPLLLAMMVKVA